MEEGIVLLLALRLAVCAGVFPNPWGSASPEGSFPNGGLVVSRGTIYGTTSGGAGGFWGYGTVFSLKTGGKGFKVLHHFTALSAPKYFTNGSGEIGSIASTNSDGAYPAAGLVLSGRTLYGTASEGGSAGAGAVFKVNTDGTGFQVLHDFSGTAPDRPFGNYDGARPMAALAIVGKTLYGTAERGGHNEGTIFKLNTDGSGFETLHTFSPLVDTRRGLTNSDGAFLQSGLCVSREMLYGTAWSGGAGGCGTVFKLDTDGSGFQVLHHFGRRVLDMAGRTGNEDGAWPEAGVVLSGDTLYGTAHQGGASGNGVVFKLKTDGSSFAVAHSFSPRGLATPDNTNADGASPHDLVITDRGVFGLTPDGGGDAAGTVFGLTLKGTDFRVIHNFDGKAGGYPCAALAASGSVFYGALHHGGVSGGGSIFKLKTDGTGFQVLHSFSAKPLPGSLTD
jgi:uncharacterized repeat protein (TIGR03803 family)